MTDADQFFNNLDVAKQYVEEMRKLPEGVTCPCCGLFNKVYKIKLSSGLAYSLIIFWHHIIESNDIFAHTKDIQDLTFHKNRGFAKLRHWGLIDSHKETPNLWKVTEHGISFANHNTLIPKYSYLFDSECLALSNELTSIRTALGDKFDYDELMRGWYDKEDE